VLYIPPASVTGTLRTFCRPHSASPHDMTPGEMLNVVMLLLPTLQQALVGHWPESAGQCQSQVHSSLLSLLRCLSLSAPTQYPPTPAVPCGFTGNHWLSFPLLPSSAQQHLPPAPPCSKMPALTSVPDISSAASCHTTSVLSS
jgi:hypothetical protein